MAKKKVTHPSSEEKITNSDDKEAPSGTATTVPMEENGDKLESLRLLNTRLLKEMDLSRRQVQSLIQSKESLETELTRSNSENEVLRTELVRMGERAAQSELERDVVDVFVGFQASQKAELVDGEWNELNKEKELFQMRLRGLEEEMKEVLREKREIEKVKGEKEAEIESLIGRLDDLEVEMGKQKKFSDEVTRDRDEMKAKLHIQVAEAERLKGILGDAERRAMLIQDEVEKLRAEYRVAMEKMEEREREIESITKDKNQMEKSLAVSKNLIEEMKNKIEKNDREKEMINDEKNFEVMKRSELEGTVTGLNEMVATFKNEEERLRRCVAELEKRVREGAEKEKDMSRRIDESVKEKNETEMRLEKLTAAKGSLEKGLNETLKQLDEDKRRMEQILNEKSQVAADKLGKDNEIVELEKQVSELKDAILRMEESSTVQKEQIKKLVSELEHYRDTLERVTTERNAARKELDEEKQNSATLKQKITEMEKNIEETLKLVEKIKAENKNMSSEKEKLESCCNILKKEMASLENDLSEARKVLDVMQDKVAAADSSSGLLLQALKATAEFVHSNLEKVASLESNLVDKDRSGEMDPYVAEQLEEIKNAFKIKENKVEEMKRQVEFLRNSVAVAQKKKNFWTIVSYATTLFAAISLALSKFYFQASP